MSTRYPRRALALALVLALASCGDAGSGPDPLPADPPQTTSDPPPTLDPDPDPDPDPGDGGALAVSVPGLPIGGGSSPSQVEESVVCGEASWTWVPPGGEQVEIPEGFSVEVTGIAFVPPTFRLAGHGCEAPSCADFSFTVDDSLCHIAAQPAPDGSGEDSQAILFGTLHCPHGTADCEGIAEQMEGSGGNVRFEAPFDEGEPHDEGETADEEHP